jgi:stress response protein YsnF
MAKTVVGLMDNMNEAQDVVRDLVSSGFDRESISIMTRSDEREEYRTEREDRSSGAGAGAAAGAGTGAVIGGLAGLVVGLTGLAIPGIGWVAAAGPLASTLAGAGVGAVAGGIIGALVNMGVPEEDAHYYAEGVRRGGILVTVSTEDAKAERAADVMRRHGAVDIEKRAAHWRKSGWQRFDEKSAPYTSDQISRERETIPVIEEDVHVGKREVERSGVRMYSHVSEHPVEKKVRLHEEHADVQRHKVDRPATEADLRAAKDTSYEVRETAEKPVVSKESRVVEEVSIGKRSSDREETIRDTVRRSDVDVERSGGDETRSVSDFIGLHSRNARYRDREWVDVENDVRADWEKRHPGTWNSRRDELRREWERSRIRSRETVE